jgi:hypothetical protein
MTDHSSDQFVDINAAAGDLREVFAIDITTASGKCGHCGHDEPLAEGRLYGRMPSLVLRCRTCDGVLMRMVSAPGRTWLDMRGLEYVLMAT